jgi:hypothetical protein
VLPELSIALASQVREGLSVRLDVPDGADGLREFAREIDTDRGARATSPLPFILHVGSGGWPVREAWTAQDLGLADTTAANLAVLARRRWLIATRTLFLHDAARLPTRGADPLVRAIFATLAVYRGQRLTFVVDGRRVDGVDNLFEMFGFGYSFPLGEPTSDTVRAVLELQAGGRSRDGGEALSLYLLGPDPLEVLVRLLLGIPEPSSWRAK